MFESKIPTEKQKVLMEQVRGECQKLFDILKQDVPECREKSLALTKLEECAMWANKGIVNNI